MISKIVKEQSMNDRFNMSYSFLIKSDLVLSQIFCLQLQQMCPATQKRLCRALSNHDSGWVASQP